MHRETEDVGQEGEGGIEDDLRFGVAHNHNSRDPQQQERLPFYRNKSIEQTQWGSDRPGTRQYLRFNSFR